VKNKAFMRASELARLAGVSSDTLRHYERKGVLDSPRRSSNGYREYSPDALDRLLIVRGALRLGFKLDELARILKVRDRGGAPCREMRALAASKLDEVEEQVRQLTSLRQELRQLIKGWDARLRKTPANQRADLLKVLANRSSGAETVPTRLHPRKKKRTKGYVL
jgi:DNA-binding transcriptional MerR regulator